MEQLTDIGAGCNHAASGINLNLGEVLAGAGVVVILASVGLEGLVKARKSTGGDILTGASSDGGDESSGNKSELHFEL